LPNTWPYKPKRVADEHLSLNQVPSPQAQRRNKRSLQMQQARDETLFKNIALAHRY
jgi:hypothetical protein